VLKLMLKLAIAYEDASLGVDMGIARMLLRNYTSDPPYKHYYKYYYTIITVIIIITKQPSGAVPG
jgi:hypothetical protein